MNTLKAEMKTRGRPRSTKKRDQIMASAVELFTRDGYEGTSVEDIAARAGVSKQTVYSHFGNKETLFGLAVSSRCKQSGIDPDSIDPKMPPEQMLPEMARRFVQLINSEEAVRVQAVCISSAESHPELGRIFFERGPLQTVHVVAEYLESQHARGNLQVENPLMAAWQFLCMLRAESQMRSQFNLDRQPETDLYEYADYCVAMFLRAYRT